MNEIESQISFKKIKNRKTEPDQLCFIDLTRLGGGCQFKAFLFLHKKDFHLNVL